MDECLIHSTDFSDEPEDGFRQSEALRKERLEEGVDSFKLELSGGVSCNVHKRPGVDAFLQACVASYDTYVFTAGTQPYADPLLDVLDPDRRLKGRLFRHNCRRVTLEGGRVQFLKDLSAVTGVADPESDAFKRIVLVRPAPDSLSRPRARTVFPPARPLPAARHPEPQSRQVDNNPISFVCNPSNGIPIPDYLADPGTDEELANTLQILRF